MPTCKGAWPPWGGIFELDAKRERLRSVERELENPKVWDSPERAQALGRERAHLHDVVTQLDSAAAHLREAGELLELAVQEDDEGTAQAVGTDSP